ncbi:MULTISPECIES: hypothetical protein [Cyanophyceae]|uniref:hypothetical protein n=1 Tax=Cyanophyceae TaxID=3028117 RepID=UPI00168727B0|nr:MULTISPECIES: hypothetical protein [Cyanophyceae]MBD1914896.1 hypothetical protein [Phormidium sp. FACHB-77]MBD2028574.1 hypothetical protein [Phormidium sp. FACHB-322]MBD2051782.1 hypothetical protein [Leptolyngbya sp. FACHB-60]
MLSQQQSGPQRGEPLAEGVAKDFSLIIDEADSALGLSEVMVPVPKSGNQSWRLLMITLLSCFAASGAALGAFFWLINLPPTANCDNTASVTTDRAQLFCAQVAAESGELPDVLTALDLAGSWTTGHPLYYEVQPLIEQWSWVVLKAAEQELRSNGSMEQAQALVSHIPVDSPVFATAQETMQTWQGEWAQGEAIMATAQTALKQKDWPTASQQMLALGELNNSHWRVTQVQALSSQIRLERRAQELLSEAVATAVPGGSDRLEAALRTASQIDESTYARQQVQPYLDSWSDLLLKLGQDKWYASELDAAIALGRSAALNPSRAKVAQELIWISQARQMAQKSLTTWRISPDQLVTLYQAMLLANRLPADSPYYPQAQSSVMSWRNNMGELARLQTAQAIGQVRTKETLKSAIGQATQVPLGHPRRVQAQTMVAHWRQEIERLEDRPQLVKAHELARAKTFDSLQEAIQAASAIPLHRALRGEAQSWVYIWTSEIQVMEDRPLLNQARSLAQRGQLSQAIVEASAIKSGRALYDEARAAIAGWQGEIAAAERARLRAIERAAARQAEARDPKEMAAPVETPAEASLENATTSPPEEGLPMAPAPVNSDRRWPQSPLPDRIDTVPGTAAPAEAGTPEMPRSPQPLNAPAAEPTPVDLAPAPLPSAIPPPPLVAPSAPPPQPFELMPDPAAAPAAEPQATQPVAPVISAQPQPEYLARTPIGSHHAASQNTEVLVLGALYAGH